MRMGIVGFSLFVGGGLAYVLEFNTWTGLIFSLFIFLGVSYGKREEGKEK